MWSASDIAFADDHHTDYDKLKHFFVTAGIAGTTSLITEDFAAGLMVGMSAGIAKEMYDEYTGTGLEKKDLLADLAGSLVGASLGNGMRLDIAKNKATFSLFVQF